MKKLIVTYDLKAPGKDYTSLIKKIMMYKHVKLCESAWIISTTSTLLEVGEALETYLDPNDRIFIADLSGLAAWENCIASDDEIKKILN